MSKDDYPPYARTIEDLLVDDDEDETAEDDEIKRAIALSLQESSLPHSASSHPPSRKPNKESINLIDDEIDEDEMLRRAIELSQREAEEDDRHKKRRKLEHSNSKEEDEEDEDLKRAILLSQAEAAQKVSSHSAISNSRSAPPAPTPSSSGSDDLSLQDQMAEYRKRRLAQYQIFGSSSSSASSSSSSASSALSAALPTPGASPLLQYMGDRIWTNTLGYKSPTAPFETNLTQLLSLPASAGKLLENYLSSFVIDMPFFLQSFNLRVPTHLALHWKKSSHGDGDRQEEGVFKMANSNVTIYHPPLQPFGCMHAKLILLRCEKMLRVIISSCNLRDFDWTQISQCIWVQDFPLLSASSASPPPPPNSGNTFGKDLASFCADLNFNCGRMLREYDFSGCKAHLVTSLPNRWTGEQFDKFGHLRIRSVLASMASQGQSSLASASNSNSSGKQDCPLCTSSSLVCASSSLGNLKNKWVEEVVESFSVCHLCGNGAKNGSTTKTTIIHPSVSTVRSSLHGEEGAHVILLDPKAAQDRDFPGDKMRDYRSARPLKNGLQYLSHAKLYIRKSTTENVGWAYIGSANFSGAAMGRLEKQGAQVSVANYEIGVVLPFNAHDAHKVLQGVPFDAFNAPRYAQEDAPYCQLK